ncbi:uncharacterized protein Z520_03904 [Fonsecaea multimorphosa CBS 102226]|uniref:Acyl-coenzyme A oxidase n=1 Tax=Fonsecaea multimorphosa CBS 102226 TaxID=1442371 RepID=A0A0D2KTY0_9EURO|nr:uncharacterized protein Z520_03904 [Fonsecaea multimorphosa CBS 102226]KIY00219.1 hypothetical protein Z520_03904 [Fonsecaea multimorphosa CBS 102226]OAL27412.1 hypothetical protein AYO22_03687 [Fonsecaea multimorphosa]
MPAPATTPPSTTPLANFLWGEERLRRRCEILAAVTKNPVFTQPKNPHALSRRDLWVLRLQQGVELLELKFRLGWSNQQFVDATKIAGDLLSIGVNFRIFIRNLEAQMSPEQKAYWIPKAERFEISGCYAQTELGHGSNVRGIETTATFDPVTDEIVVNSPTLSSHKYWIGSLGVVATHALVIARLIVRGKDLGNHVFLVQVRDLDTHELMPNVRIYEQGEKGMGTFASMDNGVMAFADCRIPRANMLAGMVSLDKDGTYHAARNTKHAYTSMVIIRGLMSEELGIEVAKAVVIALKYVQFRRQFNPKDGLERKVVEYASVQNRLFPALARAVAMMLLGREMRARIDNIVNESIEDLHLQTVGAKIWASEHGVRDVEVARLSCGGHGNMAATGLGSLYAQLSPSRTYEGETYVLSQQIGNAVVKHWKNKSEHSINALSYLARLRDGGRMSQTARINRADDWFSAEVQENFLEHRAAVLARRHIADVAGGKDTSYDVFELTMAHADLTYWRGLQAQVKQTGKDDRAAMEALANVFALNAMVEGLAAFAGEAYLSATQVASLRAAYQDAIAKFASHADTLVAAFGFTEFELGSVFARSSENPYEGLLDVAKQSELTDNTIVRPTLLKARNLWKKYERAKI